MGPVPLPRVASLHARVRCARRVEWRGGAHCSPLATRGARASRGRGSARTGLAWPGPARLGLLAAEEKTSRAEKRRPRRSRRSRRKLTRPKIQNLDLRPCSNSNFKFPSRSGGSALLCAAALRCCSALLRGRHNATHCLFSFTRPDQVRARCCCCFVPRATFFACALVASLLSSRPRASRSSRSLSRAHCFSLPLGRHAAATADLARPAVAAAAPLRERRAWSQRTVRPGLRSRTAPHRTAPHRTAPHGIVLLPLPLPLPCSRVAASPPAADRPTPDICHDQLTGPPPPPHPPNHHHPQHRHGSQQGP